jgi:hypothetical protein
MRGGYRYTEEFLKHAGAFALDPFHLPLEPTPLRAEDPATGIHAVFEDSLPDAWGRAIMCRRYKRKQWIIHGKTSATITICPQKSQITCQLPVAEQLAIRQWRGKVTLCQGHPDSCRTTPFVHFDPDVFFLLSRLTAIP